MTQKQRPLLQTRRLRRAVSHSGNSVPIEYRTGDLFAATDLDAYAHGVNCAGAMGKGIAVEFKRRWPEMYWSYRSLCNHGELSPGQSFTWWDRLSLTPCVFNLATQKHWRTKAVLRDVASAVDDMIREATHLQRKRIGMPRIATGLGGLPWPDVREVLERAVVGSDVTLVVFTLAGEEV